jgi:hypothetical protein
MKRARKTPRYFGHAQEQVEHSDEEAQTMLQATESQNVTDAGGIKPNADGANRPPPPANPRLVGEILWKQRRPSQLANAAHQLGNWLWQGYRWQGGKTISIPARTPAHSAANVAAVM